MQSHPVWVRGLKHIKNKYTGEDLVVAPCMGAWIETPVLLRLTLLLMSHPVWVRGLKHSIQP